MQIWKPFLRRLELPEVTPHSARHSYISNLQAAGIEVALVAKLAGHVNPVTTLGAYSHAVRGSEGMAAEAIEASCVSPQLDLVGIGNQPISQPNRVGIGDFGADFACHWAVDDGAAFAAEICSGG